MGGGLNIFYLMGFVVGHIFHYTNALLPSTKDSGIFDAPRYLRSPSLISSISSRPTFPCFWSDPMSFSFACALLQEPQLARGMQHSGGVSHEETILECRFATLTRCGICLQLA